MEILILRYKVGGDESTQFRWARRIKLDGNGALIIYDQEGTAGERLLLNRLLDLRIHLLPAWTGGLECRA